jgi:predicted small lipoprotein YifL
MPRLLLIACLALAACGADGPPEPPSQSATELTP